MLKHHVVYYDEDKTKIYFEEWRLDGLYHREDGPAFICYFEDGSIWYEEYWINHVEYTEEEWFEHLSTQQKVNYLLKGQ